MFKESKGIEYALEVLKALSCKTEPVDAKGVCECVNQRGKVVASQTYLAKILPRMVKVNLIKSSDKGYIMVHNLQDITVDMILNLCELPDPANPLYQFCTALKSAMAAAKVVDYYDFA